MIPISAGIIINPFYLHDKIIHAGICHPPLRAKKNFFFFFQNVHYMQMNTMIHLSQLRDCGPVIPGILSLQPELVQLWYAVGCHSTWSIMVMNTISLLLLGGHALTSPKGGRPCLLGTFDYGVVGHLAFQLT